MKVCGLEGLREPTPDSARFRGKQPGAVPGFRENVRAFIFPVCAVILLVSVTASSAAAQSAASFAAAASYNVQPGTVPVGVATGVFNSSGGQLDFAVLEQVPNTGSYQIEVFHGKSNGTFCTNCSNATPNPDVIALGSGAKGYAIAAGQFRSGGPLDIAVGVSTGIVFLQNNGTGTFTLDTNPSDTIAKTNGYAVLTVGQFNGANTSGTQDIAAVTPTVSGSVNFTVFFSNGDGTFTAPATYSVNSTWNQCTAIMPGNFQSQTKGSDLALLCNNPSYAGVLVYLNSGSSGGYAYTFGSTPYTASKSGVSLPSAVVGTLNGLATIFVSSLSNSFTTYQSNGLVGQNNAFTSVFMVPVGLAPHNPLAILYNSSAAVDFVSGPSVSTFTSYTQSGTSVNGTWNSTPSLGPPGQALATGYSPNLTQGAAYVVIDAGAHSGSYPNFQTYVDERSISVFLITLNADGTVATTNTAPVYASNAGSFPPSFATGDFNGDGTMDLAVGGADNSTGDANATIYLANSNGSLPPTTSTPSSVVTVNNTFYSGTDAIAAGKFRSSTQTGGKALYDLAIFSFNQISIQTSNGDGTFTAGNFYSLSSDPNYPGFEYRSASGAPPFAPVLTAVDVNGDGIADLVLTLPENPFNCSGSGSASQGAVYVLISNGDGTFQSPVFYAPPVVNPVSVAAAKFFGGTAPDLVFANGGELCSGNTAASTGVAVGILKNNGSGVFAPPVNPVILSQSTDAGVPNISSITSADMDGNGSPDLIVSSTIGIQVLLNQGGGVFAPTAQGVGPLYGGDVVPGPLCNSANNYVGCVTYDSQIVTGSFFAASENDVAVSVAGLVYLFQNQGNLGTLLPPTQGFVAGPDSTMIGTLAGSGGLNNLLVATSQGTAYLANSAAAGPAIATFIPYAYATSIDFGTVEIGQTSPPSILELYNGGTGPLQLYAISLIDTSSQTIQSAPFVLNSIYCNTSPGAPVSTEEPVSSLPNLTLQPGIACDFTLTMQPTAQGTYTGTFNFLDNAAQTNAPNQQPNGQNYVQTIQLTGTVPPGQPYATFTPTGQIFQNVSIDATLSSQISVTNTGNGVLTLDLVYFNLLPPSTANGFSYNQVLCGGVAPQFPITLNPNQSCTVTVQFTATAGGTFSTSLYFLDNAGPSESNVSTTGTAPDYIQAYSLSANVIVPSADVSIVGEPGPAQSLQTGSPVVFNLGLADYGPSVANNPVLTFSFSSEVLFDSLTYAAGSIPPCPLPTAGAGISSFTCKFVGLAIPPGPVGSAYPGEITSLTVTPLTPGNLSVTITISSDDTDPNLSNNTIVSNAAITGAPPPPTVVPVSSVSFSPTIGSPVPTGNAPSSFVVADFNKDGNLDYAVVNTKDNTVSVFLGSSIGTFTQVSGSPYSTTPCCIGNTQTPIAIAAGDFNGDGNIDLAITTIPTGIFSALGNQLTGLFGGQQHVGGGVSILLGKGDGTFYGGGQFNNPNNFGTNGDLPTGIAVADFNGDGKLDLAVTNLDSNNVSIMLGDGQGNFGSPMLLTVGTHPAAVATFLAGGSLPNLAVANADDGTVEILLNLGAASFRPAVNSPINVGIRPIAIAANDVNGDGKTDLVVANYSSSTVSVLLGNGNGTFAAPRNFPVGAHPMSVAVADLNFDGYPDVLVANNTGNNVSLLTGHGDGTFAAPRNFSVLQAPSAIALGTFGGGGLGFATLSTTLDSVGFYTGNVSCVPGALGVYVSKNSGWSFPPRSTVGSETLTITNGSSTYFPGPIYVVVSSLSSNATLNNPTGSTRCEVSQPSPYVAIPVALAPGASTTVTLSFSDPTKAAITYTPVFLSPGPPPFIP